MFRFLIVIAILIYFIDNRVFMLWLFSIYIFFMLMSAMPQGKEELIDWNYPKNRYKSAGKYSIYLTGKIESNKM